VELVCGTSDIVLSYTGGGTALTDRSILPVNREWTGKGSSKISSWNCYENRERITNDLFNTHTSSSVLDGDAV
jgi:hypothetical protein